MTAIEPMAFLPKVSIIIPVYNGADFLSQAIDSALAQTYSRIEILVVNDGSGDDGATERIALSYGNKVRYFSKANGGVASALNVGIHEMTGEYFSWLSHDDLYYPDKVHFQIQALSDMVRERTILYGDYAVFSEDPDAASKVRLSGVLPEHFRFFITVKNILHSCTVLIPRTAFEECGVFNETLRTTQDYDLWFRMAEKYNFIHIPQTLVKARHHAGQGSVKMHDTALAEINALLTNFVVNLKERELVSATTNSISLAYTVIVTSMLRRGFERPARHAKRLAIESIRKGSVLNGIRTVAVLLFASTIYTQFGRFRASLAWSQTTRLLRNKFFSCRAGS
jgi:glycosyltransferase involved in cell wall biosynthesis